MRLKILPLALVAALVPASAALAEKGPRPEHGKPSASACKPSVSLVLKGTFAAAAGDSAFTMNVARANRHGRALKGERTIKLDEHTKLRRLGNKAKLSDFREDDRLNVQVRACKKADAATLELLAKRVNGHPAEPETEEQAEAA